MPNLVALGPRALGNRSLLSSPLTLDAKVELNKIKKRQWWRPVAPVVMEDHAAEWFYDIYPSPFMLQTFVIREERRSQIPAVAHMDFSARVQTLTHERNPLLYEVIERFHHKTGVPMLCNTSLNDRGEPIIDTIAQAFNFCIRKRIKVGYFNGRRVAFKNFDLYCPNTPYPRNHIPFSVVPPDVASSIRRQSNPYGLSELEMYVYLHDLELYEKYDVRTANGARNVTAEIHRLWERDPSARESAEARMLREQARFYLYSHTGES